MTIKELYEKLKESLKAMRSYLSEAYPEIYKAMRDKLESEHYSFDILDTYVREKDEIDEKLLSIFKTCAVTTWEKIIPEYEEFIELLEYSEFNAEETFLEHKRDLENLKNAVNSVRETI